MGGKDEPGGSPPLLGPQKVPEGRGRGQEDAQQHMGWRRPEDRQEQVGFSYPRREGGSGSVSPGETTGALGFKRAAGT